MTKHAKCTTEGCDNIVPPGDELCQMCGMKITIKKQSVRIKELESESNHPRNEEALKLLLNTIADDIHQMFGDYALTDYIRKWRP